jgi:hypothetical protein
MSFANGTEPFVNGSESFKDEFGSFASASKPFANGSAAVREPGEGRVRMAPDLCVNQAIIVIERLGLVHVLLSDRMGTAPTHSRTRQGGCSSDS